MSFSIDWSEAFPESPSMSAGERAYFHGSAEIFEEDERVTDFRNYAMSQSPRKRSGLNSRLARTEPEFDRHIWGNTDALPSVASPRLGDTRSFWIPDRSLPFMSRHADHRPHTDTSRVVADLLYPNIEPTSIGMDPVASQVNEVVPCPVSGCGRLILRYIEDVRDHVENKHDDRPAVQCICRKWVSYDHLAFHIAAVHFYVDEIQCRSCQGVGKKRGFPNHLRDCRALSHYRDDSNASKVDMLLSHRPVLVQKSVGPTDVILEENPLSPPPRKNCTRVEAPSTHVSRHRSPSVSPSKASTSRFNPISTSARAVSVDPETWTPHQYYGGKYPAGSYPGPPPPQYLVDAFNARTKARDAANKKTPSRSSTRLAAKKNGGASMK